MAVAMCTSCGALVVEGCACAVADTDCIEAVGSGNAGNLMTLAPAISPNPANLIECGPAGLSGLIPDLVRDPPGVRVRLTSTQSVPNLASTRVAWDISVWDTDGFFDPASPDVVRVPISGLYLVLVQIRVEAAATTGSIVVSFEINGDDRAFDAVDATPAATPTTIQAFGVEPMTDGAGVAGIISNRTGAARNLENNDNGTFMILHRLGDLP